VVHIRDRANDVSDHAGRAASGHAGVDLVDVTITADGSGLTVVFTCHGNIPKTSEALANDGKHHDELAWGADFLFTGNHDDGRRYFQLGARLAGAEWRGEISIFVGSTPGRFKLNDVPVRNKNKIIISVPWSKPVTATKVNGAVVTLPRVPKMVFVGAATQYDFSPPTAQRYSGGGDLAPEGGKRVAFSF
jgi:hypothetical protein